MPVAAQTLDDGLLFPRHQLRVGAEFGRDEWNQYWEATLKRSNDNIGTLRTRTITGMIGYGASARLRSSRPPYSPAPRRPATSPRAWR